VLSLQYQRRKPKPVVFSDDAEADSRDDLVALIQSALKQLEGNEPMRLAATKEIADLRDKLTNLS
jgi:hypothetical protein